MGEVKVYPKKIVQAPLLTTKVNLFFKNPFITNSIDEIEDIITELNSFDDKSLFLLNVVKLIHDNLEKKLMLVLNPEIDKSFITDFNIFLGNTYFGDIFFLILSFYTDCIRLGDKRFFTLNFTCPKCGSENELFITLDDMLNKKLVKIVKCNAPFCFKDITIEKEILIRKKNTKITFYFYLPTLKDFFETYYYHSNNLDFSLENLFHFMIKKIVINKSTNDIVIDRYSEIYDFINNLPTKIFDEIFSFYSENVYKQFVPELSYKKQCFSCNNEVEKPLDIFSFFNKKSLVEFLDERLKSKVNLFISMYFLSNLNFSNIIDLSKLPPHVAKIIVEHAEKYIEKQKMEYEKIKEGKLK